MASQGAIQARSARVKVKALHVPRRGVSNSLSRCRFGETESSRLGQVDSIVLRVCYARDIYGSLRRIGL